MDLTLVAKHTAVVLVDLENGIVARELAPHAGADVVKNCLRIADAVRASGGTVVFVHVLLGEVPAAVADSPTPRPATPPPASASELVPEIVLQAGDHVVTKRQWGAFYGTSLEQHLLRRGVKTVILGGIATNFGVESTARAAFDRGYELVFAEDAMTTMNAEWHAFSVGQMFPRMGRVRSTEEITAALKS